MYFTRRSLEGSLWLCLRGERSCISNRLLSGDLTAICLNQWDGTGNRRAARVLNAVTEFERRELPVVSGRPDVFSFELFGRRTSLGETIREIDSATREPNCESIEVSYALPGSVKEFQFHVSVFVGNGIAQLRRQAVGD